MSDELRTWNLADASGIREEVYQWVQEVQPVLERSSWAPMLFVRDVGVLDAYLAGLNISLLTLARQDSRRPDAAEATIYKALILRVVRKLKELHRERVWKQLYLAQKAISLSHKPEHTPVVFWPVEPTHLKQQIPVAAALTDLGIRNLFVTGRPKIFDQLRVEGFRPIHPWAAWPTPLRAARTEGAKMATLLAGCSPGLLPPFPARCEPEHVIQALKDTLRAGLPITHEAVATTQAIIAHMSPQVIVVGNDVSVEGRVATRYAQMHSLQTVSISHGNLSGEPLDRVHIVDKFLVYGEAGRREMIGLGMHPARLEVCGAPYLDKQPAQSGRIHPTIAQHLGLREDKPLVLFATSGPGHCTSHTHFQMLVEAVMRLSARLPNVHFVAKLHRKDRPEFYKLPRKSVPDSRLHVIAYETLGLDIFDWLQGCSLLLTTTSQVGVEAMLVNVPVITMDFAGEYRDVDYIEAGATIHVRNEMELESAVRLALESPERLSQVKERASRFLEDAFYLLDGKSSWRCAEVIRRCLADAQ